VVVKVFFLRIYKAFEVGNHKHAWYLRRSRYSTLPYLLILKFPKLDVFVEVAWVIECACKLFIECGVISW
jgi:hypothetical protein